MKIRAAEFELHKLCATPLQAGQDATRVETSGVLLKKVKHSMVCHPERSEGSRQLFSFANCGDASLRSA